MMFQVHVLTEPRRTCRASRAGLRNVRLSAQPLGCELSTKWLGDLRNKRLRVARRTRATPSNWTCGKPCSRPAEAESIGRCSSSKARMCTFSAFADRDRLLCGRMNLRDAMSNGLESRRFVGWRGSFRSIPMIGTDIFPPSNALIETRPPVRLFAGPKQKTVADHLERQPAILGRLYGPSRMSIMKCSWQGFGIVRSQAVRRVSMASRMSSISGRADAK